MKKLLLLAGLASLSWLPTYAQQTSNPFFGNRAVHKNAKIIQRLIQLQSAPNTAQKPTGLKQRVVAQAMNTPSFMDSARFTYTGTNGSVYDFNNSDYNYADHFTYESQPMFSPPYETNSSFVLADSIIKYDATRKYSMAKAFYRTDKKTDSTWLFYLNDIVSPTFILSRNINAHNPQGYLTATYSLFQNSAPSWDTFSYQHLYYNSAFTRMDRDSIWIGMPSPSLRESNVYYYGASGKLDSFITWDLQGSAPFRSRSTIITYTGAGKLETVKSYDLEGGTPLLESLDSMGYTSGVAYYTYYESNQYEHDTLYDGTREIKFVGTGGLVDSVKGYGRDGESSPWAYLGVIKYAYNSYNNPEKLTATMVGIPQPFEIHRFYYELYDDALSILPVAANPDFNVYPNPFQNNISIDWKGKQQSTVALRLVNILGQEVYSRSLKLNNGKNTLDLPALNSGNYILVIVDAEGRSWSSKVVKQ